MEKKNESRGLTKQRQSDDRILSRSAECTDVNHSFFNTSFWSIEIILHEIRPPLAKTRDFCHRVMYDLVSTRIVHRAGERRKQSFVPPLTRSTTPLFGRKRKALLYPRNSRNNTTVLCFMLYIGIINFSLIKTRLENLFWRRKQC